MAKFTTEAMDQAWVVYQEATSALEDATVEEDQAARNHTSAKNRLNDARNAQRAAWANVLKTTGEEES